MQRSSVRPQPFDPRIEAVEPFAQMGSLVDGHMRRHRLKADEFDRRTRFNPIDLGVIQ